MYNLRKNHKFIIITEIKEIKLYSNHKIVARGLDLILATN